MTRSGRLVRRVGMGAVALLVVVGVVLNSLLPHLVGLLREGFPAPTWPAAGQFEIVQGAETSFKNATLAQPPGPAMDRFVASGGRAILAERAGRIVSGAYAPNVTQQSRFNSYSLVKSLVGVLLLRAVADGKVASLDDDLRTYLGSDAPAVSLREVLTMTSGLLSDGEPAKSMDDGGFSPFGPLAELHVFGLSHSLPDLAGDPAARGSFRYQSVNTALLGAVLEDVYQNTLPELLSRMIWKPAGAQSAYWRTYPQGTGVSAYCCLYARPMDWVLVGRFLLDNGGDGGPFLPQALWRDWVLPDLPSQDRRAGAYGWHLRHDVLDRDGAALQGSFAYFFGHSGQLVYLLPEADAVVVRFGETMPLLHSTLYELFPEG